MKGKFSVTFPDGTGTHSIPQRVAKIQKKIATTRESPIVDDTKVTVLPIYGIRITKKGRDVVVTSALKATNPHDFQEGCDEMNGDWRQYNGAMEAIEVLIACHAAAGVKVDAPKYLAGIDRAVDDLKMI